MFKKKKISEEQNNETPVYETTSREKVVKVLKIAIPIVLILLLVFIVVKVAFGNSHDVNFDKEGVVSDRPVSATNTKKGVNGVMLTDQGMTVIAENEYLMMSFSNKDDLFIIKDKKTGETFRSYPEPIYETTLGKDETSDLPAYDLSTETGQFITSPVFVGYTKSGMDGGFVLGVNQMKRVKTVYYIENGVRIRYEMTDLQLEFSVEITIENNELVYRIPVNGIIEREGLENEQQDRRPLLASLSVLPYLGAHRNGQEGYFVTPDGTGALTRFDVARISNYNEYSKKVYGSDLTFDNLETPDYNNMLVTIGAYGIVENIKGDGSSNINKTANSMLTSFIKEGDSNVDLKISNPGIRSLPFYAIYYQFNYRNFYKLQISNSGTQYDMIVKDKQLGDVEQRITFDLSEEDSYTYVDVADKVREKLLAQWKERYGIDLTMGSNADAPILNLKMFMGAKNVFGGVANQIKVMTDFEGVQNIYNELSEKGASDLRLSLLGWQKGGYYWNCTSKLKPDSSFGGVSGLEELNQWAKDKDITLALDNNLLIIYGSPSNGATFRNAAVKQANTFYLNYMINTTSGVYRNTTDFYVLSPKYFDAELLEDVISRLKDYGAANVELQQIGDMVYSDYNEENPLYRVQMISKYIKWLKAYGENFDQVSVYTGNSYAIPFVNTVLDIPIEKSSNIVLDEQIPFMQIVYHGLVNYYSAPVNNQDDDEFYMLKSIEYGALMSYELTEEKTSVLQYTYYNGLYKSQYSNLHDEIIDRYNTVAEAVKPFIHMEITDHYQVDASKNIFCTVYSDGTRVYVSYETGSVTVKDSASNQTISFDGRGYQIINPQKGGK